MASFALAPDNQQVGPILKYLVEHKAKSLAGRTLEELIAAIELLQADPLIGHRI